MWSHVNLNKVGSCGQISFIQKKCHWLSNVNFLISTYLPCDLQKLLVIDAVKIPLTVLLLLNQYISNISNIYNPDVNLSLAYLTICDHMFSYPKSYNIFSYFWLHTWHIFCFFSYVVIVLLLQRRKGVRIYCKLISSWIESTWERILFPTQYKTVIQNNILYTNWRSISK